MKKKISIVFLFLLGLITALQAQNTPASLQGNVSYVSSQKVYVKFSSTDGLKAGDTLFLAKANSLIPALVIEQLSSISCVSTRLGALEIKVGDAIVAKPELKAEVPKENEIAVPDLPETNEVKPIETLVTETVADVENHFQPEVAGRIKLSAYSNHSSDFTNNNQRFRYTFSLNAMHIAQSRLSLETYMAFSHRIYDGTADPLTFSNLKVYALALRYDFDKSRLYLGRKINPRIANVGAIDGVQFEADVKNFTLGAVVGARPSYIDYGVDFRLLEYGVYASHQYASTAGIMENTFSVFEQKNGGVTDRRFLYFQHINSLVQNLNLFVSFEADLYKLENGLPVNKFSFTSLYTSLRYRFSNNFSASVSYDARKNVIYYETFRNLADSILESSTRQGFRLRFNYRPTRLLSVGVSGNYSNRPEDARPTKNANAYIRYARIPGIEASARLSANVLQTAYLDGQIYGLFFNKQFLKGKLNSGLNLRHVNYNFVNSSVPLKQYIAEISLDWRLVKKLSLSTSFEGVFETDNQYNRFYISLRKRF